MKFTSVPAGFSSFRSPLVYAFDAEGEARDITFAVVDTESGAAIGSVRQYAAAGGRIDIAPVLRRAARCRLPDSVADCGVVDTGGRVKVRVEAEGAASPVRTFIAAEVGNDLLYKPLTTQHARRTIAADEFDLIGYFAMPDAVVVIRIEAFGTSYGYRTVTPPAGGQRTVAVAPRGFGMTPERMRVTVEVDGEAATVIEYEVVDNLRHACRVAWINRHGAPELYTFPACRHVAVGAAREHVAADGGGCRQTVTDGGGRLRVVSAYEPHAQMLSLAAIAASPDVRLVRGGGLRRVCVADDAPAAVPCDAMWLLELELLTDGKEAES